MPTFAVTLSNPSNATIGAGTGLATILNDDFANPPPMARNDQFEADEDTGVTGSLFTDNGNGPDQDPQGEEISVAAVDVAGVSLTLGVETDLPQGGAFTVNADGTFSFDPDGDFEDLGEGEQAQITFSYTVEDEAGQTDDADVLITVIGANDDPVITSPASIAVDENEPVVGSATATDVDSTNLSFSILDGGDGALFEIDADSEVLSFLTAPDFENPGDADTDNAYRLTVLVEDGDGGADQQAITVNVQDVEPEGGRIVIEGTSGIDNLVGSDAAEILKSNGGPLDQVRGGGEADVFEFTDIAGAREVLRILDYSTAEGDVIDLGGRTDFSALAFGSMTFLLLGGEDRDTVIVDGISDPDELIFA